MNLPQHESEMDLPLHLPQSDYHSMPWKNGTGSTDEVWLWPPRADRDRFHIRISRAPIPTDSAFSAFPGADRVITVIEGKGLALDFGDRVQALPPLSPFRFDTGLAPTGRPASADLRVFNVMAGRDHWRIESAVIAQKGAVVGAGLLVILALEPQHVTVAGNIHDLALQDTLILPHGTAVLNGAALVIMLQPA